MTVDGPPPPSALAEAPGETTIVCCIEHGRLEDQTLLMLRSLRENGGRLGRSRVLAVVGRLGAPLRRSTVDALRRLDVELVRGRGSNPAPWFNYANKIVAVGLAEALATTDTITWLDSDVLIAREPTGLVLRGDEAFAGRGEFLPPAVEEHDPTHAPYWERVCALLGTSFETLPLVQMSGHTTRRIRLFFNSGVFSWRRGSAFAPEYERAFVRLLKSRLAQHDGNFFTADQVVIAPVLLAHRLPWRHLDIEDHFMVFQGQLEGSIAAPHMADARLLHYSRSLNAPHREVFLRRLKAEVPALHAQFVAWEREHALAAEAPAAAARALATTLKAWRRARWMLYEARIERAAQVTADTA